MQQAQLVRKEGLAIDFDQRLRNALRERIQARAQPAREYRDRQHGAHDCASTVVP